jgi:hypothetical protein
MFEWRTLFVGGVNFACDITEKTFRRQNVDGTRVMTHRYSMMNEIGQPVLCVNLDSTSMLDPGLVLAHERYHETGVAYGRAEPREGRIDNPNADGGGTMQNNPHFADANSLPQLIPPDPNYKVVDFAGDEDSTAAVKAGIDWLLDGHVGEQVLGFDKENTAPLIPGVSVERTSMLQFVAASGGGRGLLVRTNRLWGKAGRGEPQPLSVDLMNMMSEWKLVGNNIKGDITGVGKDFACADGQRGFKTEDVAHLYNSVAPGGDGSLRPKALDWLVRTQLELFLDKTQPPKFHKK